MLEMRLHPTIRLKKMPRETLLCSMPLLQSVFLSPETHHAHGNIVAFTAASDAEDGVTHVAQTLAIQLAALTERRVLIAKVASLQSLRKEDYVAMLESCTPTDSPNVWILTDEVEADALNDDDDEDYEIRQPQKKVDSLVNRSWKYNLDFGRNSLLALRQSFDFILIDCDQLQEAAIIAPIVDGVVIVVTANRTRRGQIRRAQQNIEMTGGKIAGFVLDRYRCPLPSWLYKRL